MFNQEKTHEGILYEPGLHKLEKETFDIKQLEKPDNKFKINENQNNSKNILQLEESKTQIKKSSEKNTEIYEQNNINKNNIDLENDILMLDSDDSASDDEYYNHQNNFQNQNNDDHINQQQNININQNQNNLEEKKKSDTDIQLFSDSDEDEESDQQEKQIDNQLNKEININDKNKQSSNHDEQVPVNNNIKNQQKQKNVKIFTKDLLKLGNDANMRQFLTKPLVKGYEMQCYIKREKSGLNWFQPKYHLMLSDGGVYLISAKKLTANKSTNITLIQQNMGGVEKADDYSKQNTRFLGKLRGDFKGNFYTLYDTGLNPKKTKDENVHRRQLGFFAYENKFSDQKQPTKMRAILPQVDFITFQQKREFLGKDQSDDLKKKYLNQDVEDIQLLTTKPPLYSQQHKTFYLNFGPRIQKQSIKNYQIIEQNGDPEQILLLSGRSYKDDIFVLDFTYPFSPLQAFALALTGFVYKA